MLVLEHVAETRGLGPEIALVMTVRRDHMGHPLGHHDPAARQPRDLLGVVGHEPDPGEAELPEHLRSRLIDAFVRIETELTAGGVADPKFSGAVLPRIPARRWGQPDDFGGIAVYLMSDASRYHTGDSFVIDGAYTIF